MTRATKHKQRLSRRFAYTTAQSEVPKADASAAGGAVGFAGTSGTAAAACASRVRSGAFCVRSSLDVPFLVISEGQLVNGVPSPSPEDWREILELSGSLAKQWESRGAPVLADFEGAFMGFEGEVMSAAFQRTWALDPKSLQPMPNGGASKDMGLLVDMRSEKGVALVKRIMESDKIKKVIWGADNDVVSLRYTPVSKPHGIHPSRIVDAQLGFSNPGRRLGMSEMLKRLPPKSVAGLPNKSAMDFVTAPAYNQRAFHLPMDKHEAAYSVDDLHRLDAVVRTQKPTGGSYLMAEARTSGVVSQVLQNPLSISAEKLLQFGVLMGKRSGLQRQVYAVMIKRHLMATRRLFSQDCHANFGDLERQAGEILAKACVCIPEDLSFATGGAGSHKASVEPQEEESSQAPGGEKLAATEAPVVPEVPLVIPDAGLTGEAKAEVAVAEDKLPTGPEGHVKRKGRKRKAAGRMEEAARKAGKMSEAAEGGPAEEAQVEEATATVAPEVAVMSSDVPEVVLEAAPEVGEQSVVSEVKVTKPRGSKRRRKGRTGNGVADGP